MANIAELPADLIDRILDFMPRKDLCAVALSCRRLQNHATPSLYRDVSFVATNSKTCARKLAQFLRTILERPHLIVHVTVLRLLGSCAYWDRHDPWAKDIRQAGEVKLWSLDRRHEKSSHLKPEMFYHFLDDDMNITEEQLCGRSKDGLAALVMTQLTNIEALELGDGFMRHSIFLPQIMKRSDYLFPALRSVIMGDKHASRDGAVVYVDLNLIRPLFCSTILQQIECSMSQPWQFRWIDGRAPSNTNITNLCLFRTNINRSTLQQLLSATPNLQSFRYEQEILFNASTSDGPSLVPFLELEGLNRALGSVQGTLKTCQLLLRLASGSMSLSEYPISNVHFPPIEGILTTLKQMPRLRVAEVPMAMLFGWLPRSYARLEELLPMNIVELTLRDDFLPFCYWSRPSSRERRISRITKYVKDHDTCAPQLETLKVRLTGSKVSLRDAVRSLNDAIDDATAEHEVVLGRKSETYCWTFPTARATPKRLALAERVDSMLRPSSQ
ncbi:hypothetical protein ACN47E_003300 [Coniothyrium glycines]